MSHADISPSMRITRYLQPGEPFSLKSAQRLAEHLQVPLPYLFADGDLLAEAILGFGLLTKRQQRIVVRLIQQLLFATGQ
ncbi:hypothetical protein GCM10027431_15050 [Lysobacter rhizosphaerae]